MDIKVKLFATLREGRGKVVVMPCKKYATPRGLLHTLQIPEEDVAILLVNGRDGDLDKELIEGDYLSVFPPVGGG